jgi:hypothetical protein
MKFLKLISFIILAICLNSCSVYNFTGAKPIDAKTFQVNFFQNNAELIEPGLERKFTIKLQEIIQNQTNLSLTNSNGDLLYEGEIVEYRITPMASNANQQSSQNRMTITINVRYSSKNSEDDNFEKRFSFFHDYDANLLPSAVLNEALEIIYERINN